MTGRVLNKLPNVLIIMSDQHAPDAAGAFGHPAVKTPNLDRLAARGVRFSNAYCPYPMCTPSRAGFMTGHNTPQHGVWELGTPLPTDMPTWAHGLRHAGYRTTLCGRMHFIGPDKHHGFEHIAHPDVDEMMTPFCYGDWDAVQQDDHVMVGAVRGAGPADKPTFAERYDEQVCESALRELDNTTSRNDERPWALTVGFFLPHFPYSVNREWYDQYDGIEIPLPRTPPNGNFFEDLIPGQLKNNRKWLGLTSDGITGDHIREARRCYYAMITHMDHLIGRIFDRLEATGQVENTWILYTSDHGDNMGEHGFWSKLNFWEDSVKVPFVLAPPDCSQAGETSDALISLIDWFPTLLDLTGSADYIEPLPGRSLLPLLENTSESWPDRHIASDYACDGTRVPMRMIRQGPWKACFTPGYPPSLYNLDEDPYEWHDLGECKNHRGRLNELETLAESDGWDPQALATEIVLHKRRLKYIHSSAKPE